MAEMRANGDSGKHKKRLPLRWLWGPLIGFVGGVGFALFGSIKFIHWIAGPAAAPQQFDRPPPRGARVPSPPDQALVPLEPTEQPEITYPDGRIEHPWVRRETRDVYAGTIVAVLAAVVVLACLHLFSFRHWFRDYEARAPDGDMAAYRTRGASALPQPPRLEQLGRLADDPRPNVFLRQEHAEQALDRYGPTEHAGFVQVPIARAIELLPKRVNSQGGAAAAPAKSQGLLDAGESNSGRLLRGESP